MVEYLRSQPQGKELLEFGTSDEARDAAQKLRGQLSASGDEEDVEIRASYNKVFMTLTQKALRADIHTGAN